MLLLSVGAQGMVLLLLLLLELQLLAVVFAVAERC